MRASAASASIRRSSRIMRLNATLSNGVAAGVGEWRRFVRFVDFFADDVGVGVGVGVGVVDADDDDEVDAGDAGAAGVAAAAAAALFFFAALRPFGMAEWCVRASSFPCRDRSWCDRFTRCAASPPSLLLRWSVDFRLVDHPRWLLLSAG